MLPVLVTVASLILASSAVDFNRPCYVDAASVNGNSRNNSASIPVTCKHGTVAWDYPMGVLRVLLTNPGSSFTFCLADSSLTSIGGVHVTTAGAYVKVPVPAEGQPTCTDSVDGEAEFLVNAYKMQLYMTYIDYTVTSKAR